MQPSTFLWQGFANGDFSSLGWPTIGGGDQLNILGFSTNGQWFVIQRIAAITNVSTYFFLTRSGSLFSVKTISFPAPYVQFSGGILLDKCITRAGILAGVLGDNSGNFYPAIWKLGVALTPTIITSLYSFGAISPDGSKLFADRLTDGAALVRDIATSVNTIINLASSYNLTHGIDFCNDITVTFDSVAGYRVYKLASGVWTANATLASATKVIGISGNGKLAVGSTSSGGCVWDITKTGSITPTIIAQPAGHPDIRPMALSEDGNIIIGGSVSFPTEGCWYWLKSEAWATAHNLLTFIASQGSTPLGTGHYTTPVPFAISANGHHIMFGNNSQGVGYVGLANPPS